MKISFRELAEGIAVISVVASLIFVGYEMRLARAVAMAEAYGQASELSNGVRAMLADHNDVWRKGCLGEEMDADEQITFAALFQAVNNNRFTIWSRAATGVADADPNIFARSMATLIYHFPGIRQAWESQAEFGALNQRGAIQLPPWSAAVQEQFQQLEAMEIPRGMDVHYCMIN